MKKLYKAENRRVFSIIAGLMIVIMLSGPQIFDTQKNVVAWWGSIYPEFCFSELNYEEEGVEKNTSEQGPKISFWLAKALDRW